EVAITVEDPGVEQLVLGLVASPPGVLREKAVVRELVLRVLVEPLHVGVRRRRVEVEVTLLDVLAVVSLGPREAKEPLLQHAIAPIPEREREAESLVVVGDSEEAVLAPAIRAGPRVLVGEVVPRHAVGRVVLPHRAPLALGEIRAPAFPVGGPRRRGGEALALGAVGALASHHGRTPGRASSRRRRRGSARGCSRRRPTRATPPPGQCPPAGRSVRTGSA